MYIDNCAMQMVLNPSQFDIMVMANIFGDIISDLAYTTRLNWASTTDKLK